MTLFTLAGCATSGDAGVEANERLAAAASRRGDWAVAADLWHRVYLADGLDNSRACLETSRALAELGDPGSAEALLRDGLKRFPESAALHELHGRVLEETGWRRAAEAAYGKALEFQPGLVNSLAGLGRVRLQLGLETSAIPPLARLVELDPSVESLRLLTEAARSAGDHVIAYDAYLHLFELSPGTLWEFVDAGSLGLSPSLRVERRASGPVCEAWLSRALELDPQCTRAHISLGRHRVLAGEDDEAAAYLLRALETDPASVEVIFELTELELRRGERDAASELLDQAGELVEDEASRTRLEALLARAEELAAQPD
ncbi:MAG: tetratricopeptide repeat protein [Planctomycetes bacterium]|nr:tetratricopeptide repeat protein [Planctomycetota bacterium]